MKLIYFLTTLPQFALWSWSRHALPWLAIQCSSKSKSISTNLIRVRVWYTISLRQQTGKVKLGCVAGLAMKVGFSHSGHPLKHHRAEGCSEKMSRCRLRSISRHFWYLIPLCQWVIAQDLTISFKQTNVSPSKNFDILHMRRPKEQWPVKSPAVFSFYNRFLNHIVLSQWRTL